MPDLNLERDEAEALLIAVREAIVDAAVEAASRGDGRHLNALMRAEGKLADHVETYRPDPTSS
jgi:hypothetical protein